MAINIKEIVADALLELCRIKDLKAITIKDIREKTGVSRQGFYNHFADKDDLIHWIYYDRVMTNFHDIDATRGYYENLRDYFLRAEKYHFFLKPAVMMCGQNCLKSYMLEHPFEWDIRYHDQWYEKNAGEKPVMEKLRFFTQYHSIASAGMTIEWIKEDMPISPEIMAKRITNLRRIGLGELLKDTKDKAEHPYGTVE